MCCQRLWTRALLLPSVCSFILVLSSEPWLPAPRDPTLQVQPVPCANLSAACEDKWDETAPCESYQRVVFISGTLRTWKMGWPGGLRTLGAVPSTS